MIDKNYICIKQVLIDDKGFFERYKSYFKIGKIYNFTIDSLGSRYTFIHDKYFFDLDEINNFFIPLDEWRELRINKILENG